MNGRLIFQRMTKENSLGAIDDDAAFFAVMDRIMERDRELLDRLAR